MKKPIIELEPEREKLDKQVMVRLTDYLYDNLVEYAKANRTTPSVIIRSLIRHHVPKAKR